MIPGYRVSIIRVHIGVQVGTVETSINRSRHRMKEMKIDEGVGVFLIDDKGRASTVPFSNITQIFLEPENEIEGESAPKPQSNRELRPSLKKKAATEAISQVEIPES